MSAFWSKSAVQRWSRSERTVNVRENLIQYSESQENLLQKTYYDVFSYAFFVRRKLHLKMWNLLTTGVTTPKYENNQLG